MNYLLVYLVHVHKIYFAENRRFPLTVGVIREVFRIMDFGFGWTIFYEWRGGAYFTVKSIFHNALHLFKFN